MGPQALCFWVVHSSLCKGLIGVGFFKRLVAVHISCLLSAVQKLQNIYGTDKMQNLV